MTPAIRHLDSSNTNVGVGNARPLACDYQRQLALVPIVLNMMDPREDRPQPGTKVVLVSLPPGFLNDLPRDDTRAISEMVGKPIILVEYDDDGRAELEFTDESGVLHYIYVKPEFIR